jgi:hypothetical protein
MTQRVFVVGRAVPAHYRFWIWLGQLRMANFYCDRSVSYTIQAEQDMFNVKERRQWLGACPSIQL